MPPLPKPDAQRRRRNATVPMTQLPAGGRKGPTPRWPFPEQHPREKTIWARIWKTPASAAWERLGWHDTVARYVRVLVSAERPMAHPTVLAEARHLEDRLGLNPTAMLRLRWEISADELAERRADRTPGPARPKVVDRSAVAGS